MLPDFDTTLIDLATKLEIERVAQRLGLTKEQLTTMAGVPAYVDQNLNLVGTRIREIVELLNRVEPWTGGLLQALAWYRGQSIPAFGDQTAEALVKRGKADAVRAYLDGIAVGGYA